MGIRLYHLEHADGVHSIMQVLRDAAAVETEIAKGAFHSPVVGYRPVTPEEADAIRAARRRPEPEFQTGVTRVSDEARAYPRDVVQVSGDDLDRMREELAAHKAEVRAMIDGLLSNIESEVVRSTQAGET